MIGDRVWVAGNKPGRIAYIGETQFAPGDWAGIVLDQPIGEFNGYFTVFKFYFNLYLMFHFSFAFIQTVVI